MQPGHVRDDDAAVIEVGGDLPMLVGARDRRVTVAEMLGPQVEFAQQRLPLPRRCRHDVAALHREAAIDLLPLDEFSDRLERPAQLAIERLGIVAVLLQKFAEVYLNVRPT